jgi:hypothetical protein
MNDFYVVEFLGDYLNTQTGEYDYEKGQRIIVWVFNESNYVIANKSDIEYIPSEFVEKVYKVKFEMLTDEQN